MGIVNSSPSVLCSASWEHLYCPNPVSCNSWLFFHQHITEFDTRNLESVKTSPSTMRLLFLLKGKQVRFPPGVRHFRGPCILKHAMLGFFGELGRIFQDLLLTCLFELHLSFLCSFFPLPEFRSQVAVDHIFRERAS